MKPHIGSEVNLLCSHLPVGNENDVSIYEIIHIYELRLWMKVTNDHRIAQLVEHRTGIAEVTGSNPVEALIFFRLLLSDCLNWKIYCDDRSSLSFFKQVKLLSICPRAVLSMLQ